MSTQVSIDRTSLGKVPLIIRSDGAAPYSLTTGGLGRPAITARVNSVTSPWLHGETVTSAVREQSSLPLQVLLQAQDEPSLELVRYTLDEALWQFSYEVTAREGETSHTWLCSPASYGTDSVEFSNVAGFFEVWTMTLPCYPIPVV